jgi:integrase
MIAATKKLWHQYHLTYDQTHDVAKEVRRALAIARPTIRTRVVARLSRNEERKLMAHAYRAQGTRGLLIKTLFQTGARVSEFVNIKADEVFFDEQMILIAKAKGGKSRYVPILPELAHELRTHLGHRTVGYLVETIHATADSRGEFSRLLNRRPTRPRLPSACIRICCAIRWRRHCWSGECRWSRSRNSSDTPSWKPRRCTQSHLRRC